MKPRVHYTNPLLRSLPHGNLPPSSRSHHLGSPNQTTTASIHETCGRRLWKMLGTLRRRSIVAIRILSIPQKTDRRPVFDAWLLHISCWNMGVLGRLFEIVRLSGGGLQRSAAEFLERQRCVEMTEGALREIFGTLCGSVCG